MGAERLNDEGVECTGGRLDLLGFTSLGLDPLASLFPLFVQAEKSGLSSSLDELIGLTDELGAEDPFGKTSSGSDRGNEGLGRVVAGGQLTVRSQSRSSQFDLSDLDGCGGRLGFGGDGSRRACEPVVDELLGVVFTDSWISASHSEGGRVADCRPKSSPTTPEGRTASWTQPHTERGRHTLGRHDER
jgi:hypothetical protein